LAGFKQQIAEQRAVPEEILRAMQAMPTDALPMDVLQASVPMMASYDPDISAIQTSKARPAWPCA
jgi:citrate synthase